MNSAICTAELAAASQPPNVLFVVGDDVGYSDFGYFNDQQASNDRCTTTAAATATAKPVNAAVWWQVLHCQTVGVDLLGT